MLGAQTPATALRLAVEQSDAVAVVLVSHLSMARRSSVESLRGCRRPNTILFYAGTSPGRRNAVPPFPGPQRRGRHHQELTDVLDGQDGIRVESQAVRSVRVASHAGHESDPPERELAGAGAES